MSSSTTIGNYEVISKLATGGMGEVFLANQRGAGDFSRKVVLKKLHPKFTTDPSFVTMFLNEARIAASFSHPNIIHIYELFQDGDGYVIAMEYVRGASVLSLLRGRHRLGHSGLPYGQIARIATAVCEALHYAYTAPDADGLPFHVIHRDVSPSNVLVGFDGQVKLVDFGIAKMVEREGVTQATTIKGKYGYLTPEQIRCHPLDQRSDLFSLGTMLWEMSVGERLFQRDNEMQMMYAILEERIPLPSERAKDYPKDLEQIVMRALARKRDERYPDAAMLAHELRECARANGWDTEGASLASLAREVLPQDQIAFGRIGSDSFSGSAERRRDKHTGTWVDDDSFASLVVMDSDLARPVTQRRRGLTGSTWITLVAMLIATLAVWLVVGPLLD
ncbi:MAG: serine/threonine-protein kinase [Kofleriaceae bacterium]